MSLGDKIRELLARKGWSASRLAGMVKVSPAAISRIIAGGDTSTSIGFRLSSALDVPPAWLFDDSVGIESLSKREDSFDLSVVSDLDLVLILQSRVNRTGTMYARTLEAIKKIPPISEASCSPEHSQVLRDAMALGGYNNQVYIGLADCLVKVQERVGQIVDEVRRITDVDMNVVGAGERSAARLIMKRLRKQYDRVGAPFPPDHAHDGGAVPDQPHPPRSRSRSTPKRRSTGEKPTATKPKPRTTAKKSASAKPQRPKRPPRS